MDEIVQVSHTLVHGKGCMGCQRHEKDIMITLVARPDGKGWTDVFLTQEQAEALVEQLQKRIFENNVME